MASVTNAPRKILLIDDDATLRQFVFPRLARRTGVSLTTAATLARAKSHLRAASFAVVFVDLHLPDGHGADLLGAISRCDPKPYVVVVSGTRDLREVSRVWRAGIDDFLHKPFAPAEFATILRRAESGERRAESGA